MQKLLSILAIILFLSACQAGKKVSIPAGNSSFHLKSRHASPSLATVIILHDDENTAVEAFRRFEHRGAFNYYELQQEGKRNLKIVAGGNTFYADPNRIFTPVGVTNTLKANNDKPVPEEVVKDVTSTGQSILKELQLSPDVYVIALHNNTNDNYSILSYRNSTDAAELYINDSHDPDNFFFVTRKKDFDAFKALGYNVALQSDAVEDDGSLSVYCQKNNIPYINIEAEHGQAAMQLQMIEALYKSLFGR